MNWHLKKFDKNKHYDASNQEKTFTDIQNKFLLNKSEYVLNAANIFKEGVKVKKHPNRISSETYVEGLILDYVKKAKPITWILGFYHKTISSFSSKTLRICGLYGCVWISVC